MSSNIALLMLLAVIPSLVSSQFCEHLEIIPHPEWCSAFFLCRFGFWTVLVCPSELMFNPDTRRCDLAENVDCINDPSLTTPEWTSREWTTRTVTWTTPTNPTFSTPTAPTFSTPSVPTFSTPIIPTFSTPTAPTFSTPTAPTFSTPTAPTFSTPTVPTFSTPDIPTTSSRTTPTRPSTPTRTRHGNIISSTEFCDDSTEPSTLPHLNCEYFYKCIDGKAFEIKCGNGLVWNSKLKFCDYPENSNCVNELIPQPMYVIN